MADLISMKIDARRREELSKPSSLVYDAPEYPYQLRIYLDDDVMRKLDMDLPAVGSKVKLEAKAEVCSVSLSDDEHGGPRKSMCIQVTAMALTPVKDEAPLEDRLYATKG